jgi:ATP-binding cassette subfamily C protein
MAHRPAAIQECDVLMVLDKGAATAFGPRDEVLRNSVKNHATLTNAPKNAGGVT